MFSTVGVFSIMGDISVSTIEDIMSTMEGHLEYFGDIQHYGGIMLHVGDIMSALSIHSMSMNISIYKLYEKKLLAHFNIIIIHLEHQTAPCRKLWFHHTAWFCLSLIRLTRITYKNLS